MSALARWPIALAVMLAITVPLLLINLGGPGLWEPQELAIADKIARDQATSDTPAKAKPADADNEATGPCPKQAPKDAVARSLTERAAAAGFSRGNADRGMRLPLVGLGLLALLGVFIAASRFAGARAGLYAALALCSFPLFALQTRLLTSDLGSAAGASLIVAGFALWMVPRADGRRAHWLDIGGGFLLIVVGGGLAFVGGGALLGLLPPLFAIALVLGGAVLPSLWRLVTRAPASTVDVLAGVGRPRSAFATARDDLAMALAPTGRRASWGLVGAALVAVTATALVLGVLAWQMYDLREPMPGTRALFGKSLVPSDCYAPALGAVWRFDDDLRTSYAAAFEQAAFGTFPIGVLALVSMYLLLDDGRRRLRWLGVLTMAWAAISWIVTAAFMRKAGFVPWAGYPALALALGVWLSGVFHPAPSADADGDPEPRRAPLLLAALIAGLAAVTLGKDVQTFPERLASLLVGGDALKYPAPATLFGAPLKSWVLLIGVAAAGVLIAALILQAIGRQGRWATLRRLAPAATMIALTLCGAFWIHGWHRGMSRALSSKHVFESYHAQRGPGDVLGILGDLGSAPDLYAGGAWDKLASREQLMTFLARPARVFALAPATDLCAIHRTAAGKPYYVLDDRNARTLLLSNQLAGATDRNPLTTAIVRQEPPIATKPASRMVFDDKVELVGWQLPKSASRGSPFSITLVFKVLAPVGGEWKVLGHIDQGSRRLNGDHVPIGGRCATSFWQAGDYIVDTFTVTDGDSAFPTGDYDVRIGFFQGSSGNFRNMRVSAAPASARSDDDRIKIGVIKVN